MEDKKELWKALLAFQSKIIGVKRDATNTFLKKNTPTYATMEAVVTAIREPMREAGLTFSQLPGAPGEHGVDIRTIIAHAESGQSLESVITVPLSKRDAQGLGSAITYGCRYSLMAMLGIPPVDDDGNDAVSRGPSQPSRQTSKPAASAKTQAAPQASANDYPAHQAAFLAAATEAVKTLNLGRIGAVVDFLRGEGFAIEDVRIMKREHMDAFLANHDAEEINGWTDLLREATNAAKEGAA